MIAVMDNDVLYKGACYGLLSEILESLNPESKRVGVLGTARFVVASRITRAKLAKDANSALEDLSQFLVSSMVLDPTDSEQRLAAEFEVAAQIRGLALDTGESQLCAIVLVRAIPLFVTGDKRAIEGIERLLDDEPRLLELGGKVRCLEQVILVVLARGNPEAIWASVCAELAVDKALTFAFGCSQSELRLDSVLEGLASYINAVRAVAPRVLAN